MDTITDSGSDASLKGKDFDEVCAILLDDDTVRGAVHKKPAEGGRWAHCFSFRPDEYSEADLLDTIVAEYGPGDYPVQFKSPDAKGRQVIRWARHMTVQQRRLSAQAVHPTPTASPQGSDAGLAMIANALAENSRILAAALERMSDAPAHAPQKDTIEVAKDLAALKDLFAPEKSSPLEAIKEVLEVMALLQNNSGGDDPLTTAIKTLLPAITKGSEELAKREAPRAENTASRQVPAPAPVVVAQHASAESESMHVAQAYAYFTANFLPTALQLAKSDRDPREVADYISRAVGSSPGMLDMIGRVISEDDMVERLAAASADVLQHAAWFDEVADWLAHAQWPETNPAPETDTATNDATTAEAATRDGKKAPKVNGIDGDDSDGELSADGDQTHANADLPKPSRGDKA